MRMFLTGGHGFIGSRVSQILVKRGDEIRCLVRPGSNTSRIDNLRWGRVEGDILDAGFLTPAMAGCDACIHLASVVSWDQIRSTNLERTLVEGTRNVLESALRSGIRRFVYVSSSSAVSGSSAPRVFSEESPFELHKSSLRYAIAKHTAEQVVFGLASNQLEIVIVNPVETYGPHDTALITAGNLIDMLKSWPAVGCHGGTGVAHVDDVADGIVRALDRGRAGHRYILGGDNLTIEELIRTTLDIAGQKKPVLILPNGLVKGVVRMLTALRLPSPLQPDVLDYATLYWFMDSTKAKRELGYMPRPARRVLEPTIAWLYQSGHVKK